MHVQVVEWVKKPVAVIIRRIRRVLYAFARTTIIKKSFYRFYNILCVHHYLEYIIPLNYECRFFKVGFV